MADNSTGQERTEEATPKRLREARERGQVARSRELNTTVMMLASAAGLIMIGGPMATGLMGLVRDRLRLDRAQLMDTSLLPDILLGTFVDMLILLGPFFALMFVAVFVGPFLMGGLSFSAKAMAPKLEKLNPLKGMKRIFGWTGLVELLKSMAKFALLAAVAAMMFEQYSDDFLHLGLEPVTQGIAHGAELFSWVFVGLAAALIVVAAVDVPFQLWDHARKLRMTRQEVKDELKETDGNPELRGRIRSLQREMSQRRMMEEVPKADVVVVNPTHYSVALRYEQDGEGAPKVVAKGTDHLALKIREIANHHGVPIYSAPPLARALHYSTEVDRTIPAALYTAVAQVLAYVYQVKSVKRVGGAMPEPPADLPVPDELLPEGKR